MFTGIFSQLPYSLSNTLMTYLGLLGHSYQALMTISLLQLLKGGHCRLLRMCKSPPNDFALSLLLGFESVVVTVLHPFPFHIWIFINVCICIHITQDQSSLGKPCHPDQFADPFMCACYVCVCSPASLGIISDTFHLHTSIGKGTL